jgi:integrase/recombinase XerD
MARQLVVLASECLSSLSIIPTAYTEPEGLTAWFNRYAAEEAGANAVNTFQAKRRDLSQFLSFFADRLHSDHPDDWTKSITAAFLRHLETQHRKPATINRVLATLRHVATWMHEHRSFEAGHPCRGIQELVLDEPAWKGLSDVDLMRLRAASEQLTQLKNRRNQRTLRDRALFLTLLHTGLRVSELLALDRRQHCDKYLCDVKRKGKVRTAKVFLPPEAREPLADYLATCPTEDHAPLFLTKTGQRLERQHVDQLLKQLAAQANSKLPAAQHIKLSAHVLRHTFLRKLTEKHGVQFAMEAAGHASEKYIWRYVKPSEEQREKALEQLF